VSKIDATKSPEEVYSEVEKMKSTNLNIHNS